jgi:uncharacterized protein
VREEGPYFTEAVEAEVELREVMGEPGGLERTTSHGKRPQAAIAVAVEECFLHCAKAFKRSGLWRSDGWPDRSKLPSLGRMLRDQGAVPGASVEELESSIQESYVRRLY